MTPAVPGQTRLFLITLHFISSILYFLDQQIVHFPLKVLKICEGFRHDGFLDEHTEFKAALRETGQEIRQHTALCCRLSCPVPLALF